MTTRTPGILLLVLAALFLAPPAGAGAFGVSPVRLDLDRAARTGLITVASDDDRKLYFQLKLFHWTQKPDAEDVYAESDDLIFFPQVMTIEPKEKRLVRVGLKGPLAGGEKAYRLFIEELPDPNEVMKGAQVAVRLRFGIPIFTVGSKVEARPEFEGLQVAKGELRATIRNAGERAVRFEELSAGLAGKVVGKTAGWYVFPGASRAFAIPIAREECPRSGTLEVRAIAEGTEIRRSVEATPALCAP